MVYAGKVLYKYKGTMPANTEITVGDEIKSISDYAFNACTRLTSITIGHGVSVIGDSAFYGCSGLTSVYYNGTAEEWANISINESGNTKLSTATLYFSSGRA